MFEVDPEHVEEFLRVDHEVWTLGEADVPDEAGAEGEAEVTIPFLSKEVWLDDAHPGRVTIVFVWESIEAWERVGADDVQRTLQARFDAEFGHRVTLVRAFHEESDHGIHRWSRFERLPTAP